MAYTDMTYTAMAYIVVDCISMAYVVMASTVMASMGERRVIGEVGVDGLLLLLPLIEWAQQRDATLSRSPPNCSGNNLIGHDDIGHNYIGHITI